MTHLTLALVQSFTRSNIKFNGPKKIRVYFNIMSFSDEILNKLNAILKQYDVTCEIDLSYNNLTQIPQSILNLKTLRHLSLRGNMISKLPDNLVNLSDLEVLDLTGNWISKIPDHIISPLIRLKTLDLSNNNLTGIPQTILNLKTLRHLSLRGNNMSKLPDNLENLSDLEVLNLRASMIFEILDNIISQLTKLKILDLTRNHLEKLEEVTLPVCPDELFPILDSLSKLKKVIYQPEKRRGITHHDLKVKIFMRQKDIEFKYLH